MIVSLNTNYCIIIKLFTFLRSIIVHHFSVLYYFIEVFGYFYCYLFFHFYVYITIEAIKIN